MAFLSLLNFVDIDFKTIVELIKLVVIIPVFIFWSLYDLITKTVMVKWQRTLIAFGLIYNFAYLFIDKNQVNDNITGFILCYLITFIYKWIKRLFIGGDFGGGDIIYCAIIGLLFGTAVGIITIVLSFLIFDGLLNLIRKIFVNLRSFSVAFFPFITAGLFIIIFFIGESNVRYAYNYVFDALHIGTKYINIF